MKHIMNDVSQAIKVALSVRLYLQENMGGAHPSKKDVMDNYQRITDQVKNISGL